MNQKSQVVIIALWILTALTILTIGIGHRVSMALRLSRYQRDRIKAYSLAKAGVNRAIAELDKDANGNYDSLTEAWSTGKDFTGKLIFENIELKEGTKETFTIGHRDEEGNYQCMEDEEGKININSASESLLATLLEECEECRFGETETQEIAKYILFWRGENVPSLEGPVTKDFKKAPFNTVEELKLFFEYFYQKIKADQDYRKKAGQLYEEIKDLITVWGIGIININTAPEDVIKILGLTVVATSSDPGIDENDANSLVGKFRSFREEKEYFVITDINTDTIRQKLKLGDVLSDDMTKIIANLVTSHSIMAISENFRIESTGKVNNIYKKIITIYDRGKRKIVSWHEN